MDVLLIEHEHHIAHTIKSGLASNSYSVRICYDGHTGLVEAANADYDLLLLDTALPDMSAEELCRTLRDNGNHTPVILLATDTQPTALTRSLDAGADDVVTRPFSLATLLAHLRALLRNPSTTTPTTLTADNAVLNTVTRTVARNQTPISLTAKEFNILEYLLRHKNEAVSKQAIMTYAWDLGSKVAPNNVEVFINYLRNKLDRPFAHRPLIETVRGFGYTIKDTP